MDEAPKDVIRRYLETWSENDLEKLVAFWDPNLVHHTREGAHGYEETKRMVGAMLRSFYPMRFRIEDMIAEGDMVATRLNWSGTHSGEYMGLPPTGRRVSVSLIGIARVTDGRIAEHWGVTDELHMRRQLGLLPEEVLAARG